MTRPAGPRVLLLWPGALFGTGRSFGVPQLLGMASAVRSSGAVADVIDLDLERAFGAVDLSRLTRRGYDVVGISCYSSFDYLKVMAIAARIRALLPNAWLVTGGYHPSARPDDFLADGSPFDAVVVGEGERPFARLVEAYTRGQPPLQRIWGPEPSAPADSSLRPDWHLLDRYKPIARTVASQAEIYLSRGCPFSCSFCMERAKRCSQWRALDPYDAVEELHRLDAYLDLSSWTVFVADALFGMSKGWRRDFLDALARRPIRARKTWVLTRLDGIEREDIAMMAVANVAPGFGLESGDPRMLALMDKSSQPEWYLEHMVHVAEWANARRVPFGANVMIGHPGETESSMRATARYLRRIFTDAGPCTGFVSIDPFRLYPGSAVEAQLGRWTEVTGMRVHRYPWWHDGDQDFLAEWIEPSGDLDFRTALRLRRELFGPIVEAVASRFAYHGTARSYFERAAREQVELLAPKRILRTLGQWHLWTMLTGGSAELDTYPAIARDAELAAAARLARRATIDKRAIGGPARLLEALVEVPRERFVRIDDVMSSAEDRAMALVDSGHATVSAMHSYVKTFGALELAEGDDVVDLGGGSGYGAAIAAYVVGPQGRVRTIEIDAELSGRAREHLAGLGHVEVFCGDAHDTGLWAGAAKVAAGFAVESIPQSWIDALAEGGMLVAPVGRPGDQRLVRVRRERHGVRVETLGEVRYVPDRSPATKA